MKTKLIFSFVFLFTATLFAQKICPKTYEATITTTYETFNNSDGEIEISGVTGGTSPYSYFWEHGDSTNAIDSLPAGLYTVTIADDSSCTYKLCVLVDRDSFPCNPLYEPNICGDTINIRNNYLVRKKNSQTGILIELYSMNSVLIHREFTDNETTNGRFYDFDLRFQTYYNESYKLVTKSVFGSDTSGFCGDTCIITIDDDRCNIFWTADTLDSDTDIVPINYTFAISEQTHQDGALFELYTEDDSLLGIFDATFTSSYFAKFPQFLYYNETYKVFPKVIYNGDTIDACVDTAIFTVQDYTCNFTWHDNSCADTVQIDHIFKTLFDRHVEDAWVILLDSNNNVLDTVLMSGSNSIRTVDLETFLTQYQTFRITTFATFTHWDTSINILDTIISCADTCTFFVDPNGLARVKGGNSSPLNSNLTSNTVVFPNPTNGLLNLDYSQKGHKEITLKIYGVNGKLIKKVKQVSENSMYKLNTAGLDNGIYLLQIQSPDNSIETVSFSVVN